MRRILFTLLVAGAMLVAIPAASVADRGGHERGDRHHEREHRREHRHRHHHVGIRHERFGSAARSAGRQAGTVSSFANGRLTIRLNDGSSVTGAVRRSTEIECEARGDRGDRRDRGHGGDDRSDDGPRHDVGDDHGNGGPGHDDGGRERHRCTTVAQGTVVRDATLTVTRFGAVWARVDLIDS